MSSDQLADALARSDVVISATGAPDTIVHRHQLEHALTHHARADSRPLVLIDLSTPRDIDPAIAGLTGVELYTIDALRPVVQRTLTQRSAQLPAAYTIVRAEVARYTRWLNRRETAATLRSLSTDVEQDPNRSKSTCWVDAISPALATGFSACQGASPLRVSE